MNAGRVTMALLIVVILAGYTSAIVLKEYNHDVQMNQLEAKLTTYQRKHSFMTDQIRGLEDAKKDLHVEIVRRKEEAKAKEQALAEVKKSVKNTVTGAAVVDAPAADLAAQKALAAEQAAAKKAALQAKLDAAKKAAVTTTTRRTTTTRAS